MSKLRVVSNPNNIKTVKMSCSVFNKIPWMQGSKIKAQVSRQWSNLSNDEMAMVMKVTNIYKHEIVDTRA